MKQSSDSLQKRSLLPKKKSLSELDPTASFPRRVSYSGKRIALLTQHGKESVIAPVLDQAIGCRVERVLGYNTDFLGTFTRDIPRPGTQLDAARRKARLGMERSGLAIGIASEGSFGPDPFSGLLPWNLEIVIFIDETNGVEVTGISQGTAIFDHQLVSDWESALDFARRIQFPVHHLVVRPEGQDDFRIRKGVSDWPTLEAAFTSALAESSNGQVFLETDVRAHANPSRMQNIRLAAEDLAKKLSSLCPVCAMPGFWLLERVAGLPCENCFAPTRETREGVHGCLKCDHREIRERTDRQYADPTFCDYCNP